MGIERNLSEYRRMLENIVRMKNSENSLGEPKSWFWKKMAHIC